MWANLSNYQHEGLATNVKKKTSILISLRFSPRNISYFIIIHVSTNFTGKKIPISDVCDVI